jgi:hypothetical protein
LSAALPCQLETRVHGGQSGLGEMAPLMFSENKHVTHCYSLRCPLRAALAVACGR